MKTTKEYYIQKLFSKTWTWQIIKSVSVTEIKFVTIYLTKFFQEKVYFLRKKRKTIFRDRRGSGKQNSLTRCFSTVKIWCAKLNKSPATWQKALLKTPLTNYWRCWTMYWPYSKMTLTTCLFKKSILSKFNIEEICPNAF